MWLHTNSLASLSAGKWQPSQTDASVMVHSPVMEICGTPCMLCDMGAFYLVEFAKTLCRAYVGSAVHGGIHVVQISSMKLSSRLLTFAPLNSQFKVRTGIAPPKRTCLNAYITEYMHAK